jgi:hypothetical protein
MIQITYWLGSRVMTTELPHDAALMAVAVIRQEGGKIVHYIAVS